MNAVAEDRSVLTRSAAPPNSVVKFGDEPENIADVRIARDGRERPLVMIIHGGFWRPQFDRKHTGPMCEALALAGWSVAAIEYRRKPGQSNVTLDDVRLAIDRVPSLVQEHSGRTLLVGHSAGGHLALWSAVRCAQPTLAGALALGPVSDLHYAFEKNIGGGAVLAFIGDDLNLRNALDPCMLSSPVIKVTIAHGISDEIAPIIMSEHYHSRHTNSRLVRLDCGHFAVIDPLSSIWNRILEELRRLA